MGNPLGDQLRSIRKLRGLSLAAVAEPAEISTAYLQKLEGGGVSTPSPHVLHRLGAVLNIPYGALMELAGYVVPNSEPALAADSFGHALSSADLTQEERKAVAAFIGHLREQRD